MLIKTSFEPAPVPGSIWASAEVFNTVPIVHAAICTVHHKLQLKPEESARSLSGSYAECSTQPANWASHLTTLMHLPGIFASVSPLDENGKRRVDKNGHEYDWYGYADALGISFNSDLVKEALFFGFDNRNDWMKKFDGVALFSLLQQTVEHELGHIMNHHHCLKDPGFEKKTPDKPPHFAESGFHVQEMAQKRAAPSNLSRQQRRLYKYHLLECRSRTFAPPLKGKMYFAEVAQSKVLAPKKSKMKDPETVEDLWRYMDSYPLFECSSPPGPRPETRKRPVLDASSDSVMKTPRKTEARLRASPRVIARVVPTMASKVIKKEPILGSTTKLTKTDMDGEDRHDGHPDLDDVDWSVIKGAWASCDISATFCGEDRSPREQFVVGEPVYVELNFTNNTDGTAYIHMDNTTFGREGISFVVEGLPELYITSYYGSRNSVVVALSKGESYSFFRLLCWGDTAAAKQSNIRYAAPGKAGEYTGVCMSYVGVEHMLPTCTLKVVGAQEEVPRLAADAEL